jgi:HK97 family phage portal protein
MRIPFTNIDIGRNLKSVRDFSKDFLSGNWDVFSTNISSSGVVINQDNAMSLSGIYAGVRVYSDAISSLPIDIYTETTGTRTKSVTHSNYKLLSLEPNTLMTSYVWRSIVIPYILLWGNSYNIIEFEKGGGFRPKAIMPIHPNNVVNIVIDRGVVIYHIVLDDGTKMRVDQSEMLHFRGLGNNIVGKSVLDYAADCLGGAKATEIFGNKFYENGANPSGVLSTDAVLDAPSYTNIKSSWDKVHSGVNNSNKTAILEQGLKYTQLSIPQDAAQFLETKRFSIEDQARWMKLPPHMIGDLSHATFTNIGAQDLNLVKHSILPLVKNIEQEIDRKLFREQEKGNTYVKFNLEGLLRGDIETRYNAHKVGIQNGFMTLNEARMLEGFEPLEGLDSTWMQTNTAPIVDGTNQPEEKGEEKEDETQLT